MKITADRQNLISHLKLATSAISARSQLPVLSNALFQTCVGGIDITGSDLDNYITTKCPAMCEESGNATLPARKLLLLLEAAEGKEVTIATDSKHIARISSGNSVYRLLGLSAEEFPPCVQPGGDGITLSSLSLRGAIHQTRRAVSTDETRFVLCGCLFEGMKDGIWIVATDGRRLHRQTIPVDGGSKVSFILTGQGAEVLLALLPPEVDGPVNMTLSDGIASVGQYSFVSFTREDGGNARLRLIDGNFPNWKQVVPKPGKTKIVVNSARLLEALTRAEAIKSSEAGVVCKISEEELCFSAAQPSVGEMLDRVPCIAEKIPPTFAQFGMNSKFFRDAINGAGTEEVALFFDNEDNPVILHPVREGDDFLAVLMPMRIDKEAEVKPQK